MVAACMVIAITGTFTFTVADTLQFDGRGEVRPGPDNLFTSIDYSIDWLAAESSQMSRAKGHSSFLTRSGAVRVCWLPVAPNARTAAAPSPVRAAGKLQYPTGKNAILLKLRI